MYISKQDELRLHHSITEPSELPSKYPTEAHNLFEINYIVKGSVQYLINGKSVKAQSGDMVLINIGHIHNLKINLVDGYERINVHFHANLLPFSPEEKKQLLDIFNKTSIIYADNVNDNGLNKIFFYLADLLSEKQSPFVQYAISAKLIELLIKMNNLDLYKDTNESLQDDNIVLALEFINANMSRNFTLDELAKNVFISKYYLCHLFKTVMGTSVNKYILARKMLKAKEYIESGMKASEAALNVGYDNYSSFYLSFKKTFHQSPTNIVKASNDITV